MRRPEATSSALCFLQDLMLWPRFWQYKHWTICWGCSSNSNAEGSHLDELSQVDPANGRPLVCDKGGSLALETSTISQSTPVQNWSCCIDNKHAKRCTACLLCSRKLAVVGKLAVIFLLDTVKMPLCVEIIHQWWLVVV